MPTSGGEAPREVVRLPARANSAFALAWTPNSREIIYAHGFSTADQKPKGVDVDAYWDDKAELGLWMISAEGGVTRNLGPAMNGRPFGLSVHPDGRRIAVTAGTPRRPEVWVLKGLLKPVKAAE